jgi:hypothetical protein
MDSNSNRNRIPAELQDIEETLRANRHEASPLELDRIKLQAIRQAERTRPSLIARQKGTFMKSRLALTLLLVAGFMFSTTGATLAISGSSGNGSAATSQYVAPHNEGHPHEHGVKGENTKGGECVNGGNGSNSGNSGAGSNGNDCNTLEAEPVAVETEPAPAAEQQAVVSNGSSLPFTGFVAIPLLIIGVGMILVGAVIKLKSRKDPLARH